MTQGVELDLDLTGATITIIRLMYPVNFTIEVPMPFPGGPRTDVAIEAPFEIHEAGRVTKCVPGEPGTLGPLANLLNAECERILMGKDDSLEIRLKDGRSVRVLARPDYESWQMKTPDGRMWIGMGQ